MLRSIFNRPILAKQVLLKTPFTRISALRYASTSSPVAKTEPEFSSKTVSLDRELPDPFADKKKNRQYFVVYAIGVTVSCAVIFNYEKTQSPIINSVLYCLRRSEAAKQSLGPNIGYASSWPWISGELNTVQGNIDVEFKVKGENEHAMLKLKANRESKLVPFDVKHIYLEFADGRKIDLKSDSSIDFDF